jgi:hypothetical protein
MICIIRGKTGHDELLFRFENCDVKRSLNLPALNLPEPVIAEIYTYLLDLKYCIDE